MTGLNRDRTHRPAENPEASRVMAEAKAAASAFFGEDGQGAAALLPVLHALQKAFGHVSPDLYPEIANAFNISQAEVRGVVSFYHDFRSAPAGKKVLKLCRAEACQARGAERLAAHLAERHRLKAGETASDGSLTLENVYCLGNCALGPAALLDEDLIGRLDEALLDALVAEGGR